MRRSVEMRVGGGSVTLRDAELDGLLGALHALDRAAAESVAEEIAALRVAGVRIELMPTDAELAALRQAISATGRSRPVMPGLTRLRAFCG